MTELSRKRKRYFELAEPSDSNSSTDEQPFRAYLRIQHPLKKHRQSFSEDDFFEIEDPNFDVIQPESKSTNVGKWISFSDGKKSRKLELQDTTAAPVVVPSQKRFAASAHPLDNHLILSTIFQYLGVEDMKICRLVCPQWEEEIRPLFKSKALVEIDMVCPQSGRHPTDFLQSIFVNRSQDSDPKFPSHHLRISGIDMKNGNLGRVLDICGADLRSLSLDFVPSFVEESVHTLDFKHFLKFSLLFPDLETLELYNMPDHLISKGFPKLMKAVMENSSFKNLSSFVFYSTGYFCPLDAAFVMDFMDVCPNLSKLSFSVGDDDALDEILTALEFRDHCMDRLELLKFGSGFGNTLYETHIQTLINGNLCRLAHLEINSLGVDISDNTLEWLMRNLSPVLKFLKLGPLVQISLNIITVLTLQFPLVMKNLKHLEIYDVGTLQVGSIYSILPKLPKLKKLIFMQCTGLPNNSRNVLFPSNVADNCRPHLYLRDLTLPQSLVDMDGLLVVKLLFPRLKKLSVDLNDYNMISATIDLFKESMIEELSIKIQNNSSTTPSDDETTDCYGFDSAITGIPVMDLDRLEFCREFKDTKDYQDLYNALKVWTNFSDWKNLRKLSIVSKTNDYQELNGVAVCYGFALAKNLTCLELGNFSIRDTLLFELLNKMSLTNLKLRSCEILKSKCTINVTELCKKVRQQYPHVEFSTESI